MRERSAVEQLDRRTVVSESRLLQASAKPNEVSEHRRLTFSTPSEFEVMFRRGRNVESRRRARLDLRESSMHRVRPQNAYGTNLKSGSRRPLAASAGPLTTVGLVPCHPSGRP